MKQELRGMEMEKEAGKRQATNQSFGGLVLVLMGTLFLLGQAGITLWGASPYALWAFVPVAGVVYGAWRRYEANGRVLDRGVALILAFGLMPFLYIAAGIFGFSASLIWPFGLIVAGAAMVLFRE